MTSTDWIKEKASDTLNPSQVENTLERVAESWPPDTPPLRELLEQFPLGEAALLHLISVSSVCAARLVRYPDILQWLAQPEVSDTPRAPRAMLVDLQRIAEGSTFAGNFQALRFGKDGRWRASRCAKLPRLLRSRKRPSSYRSWRKSVCARFTPIGIASCEAGGAVRKRPSRFSAWGNSVAVS